MSSFCRHIWKECCIRLPLLLHAAAQAADSAIISDCKSVPVQRAGAEIAHHLKTEAKPTETNIHQGESTIQTCKWCLMSILCQPNCHTMKDLQTRVPITTCLNVGLICWLVPRLSYVFSNQFWGLSNIAYMSPCLTKTNVHQGAASMYSPRSGSQPRLT